MADVPQTDPRASGATTSEGFWHKVSMIVGIVITVTGFASDILATLTGIIPPAAAGSMKWIGVAGAVITVVSKISYEVQRLLIKNKLIDAEAKAAAAPPPAGSSPDTAAGQVLGGDAPQS